MLRRLDKLAGAAFCVIVLGLLVRSRVHSHDWALTAWLAVLVVLMLVAARRRRPQDP